MSAAARIVAFVLAVLALAPASAFAAFTDEARNNGSAASAAGVFAPRSTTDPSVPGTPRDGVAVTASAGTWDRQPTTFAYQWRRCDSAGAGCTDVDGATALTYTPVPGDVGATLRIVVTASNTGGSVTRTSAASAVVAVGVPRAGTAPTITGSATTGSSLTASTGTWTGAATITYAYQWQRCPTSVTCADVAGQTGSSYAVTSADSGATLRVVVTATNTHGSGTQASAQTAAVNHVATYVTSAISQLGNARSSVGFTHPAGVQAGDLMIAVVATDLGTGGFTAAPAGWTLRATLETGRWSVWTRTATASEPTTHTFTFASSQYMSGTLAVYRNADNAGVTVATSGPQTTTPVAFPAHTSAPGAIYAAGLVTDNAAAQGTITHTGFTRRALAYSEDGRPNRNTRVGVVAVDRASGWPTGMTWSGWGVQGTFALRIPPRL